ncbi:MAG: ribosome small subunit-dependent GTPase A [Agathobaculum sp.]|uniref:ribosome small subunit-dependent GTPase A n=1 Tax=Agathobaculum sp. TaxID=2048138 RepID=UPI0025C2207F|nr:ribosome small subunit-dependent GTPase A [Agathobaculum sp.]MCI7126572.1 ribosome small subunit-dependent GTPase A [Agathobaculum sp.]
MSEGIILKGVGGFYYVDTADGLIACKARGKFRRTVGKPIVGDRVQLALQPEDGTGYLLDIAPRKNALVRPAVANLDMLVAVASAAPPVTDPFLIDKVTAIAVHKGMDALVVINKTDVDPGDALLAAYRSSGIEVLRVSARTGAGIDTLRARIRGKVSAFAGNSGVGKSSVLNRIDPQFGAAVGAISDRIGRGKHTTRHVELHPIEGGGYIADTPGFSSFETEQMDLVLADDLQYAFPEFAPYLGQCRFTGCAHIKEKGCAVLAAVEAGEIARTRHASYAKLYESVKDLKEWELLKGGTR